jgi:hypothetical protein
LLAKVILEWRHDGAAPAQDIFRHDLAETWRRGQQRRSQYLVAWLSRAPTKSREVDAMAPTAGHVHGGGPDGRWAHDDADGV